MPVENCRSYEVTHQSVCYISVTHQDWAQQPTENLQPACTLAFPGWFTRLILCLVGLILKWTVPEMLRGRTKLSHREPFPCPAELSGTKAIAW